MNEAENIEESAMEIDSEQLERDLRLLEAILFATPEPLPLKSLVERFPADRAATIPDVLKLLKERYKGRGVNLVKRADLWAFRTAEDLENILEVEKEVSKKLSKASLETLAIVAYHQPATRAEIESIRGVSTNKGTLDILMEAGWVKPGRRRQVPGRPLTWGTTPAFLDHFGLETLQDLPGLGDLKAAGLLDSRPAIETVPGMKEMADMFENIEDEEESIAVDNADEISDEELVNEIDEIVSEGA